jgi:hypothetical protein
VHFLDPYEEYDPGSHDEQIEPAAPEYFPYEQGEQEDAVVPAVVVE